MKRLTVNIASCLVLITLFTLAAPVSTAQTLRDFMKGQRGDSHRRIAKDLYERLKEENPTNESTNEESDQIERLIVNSRNLATSTDSAARIARLGGRLRQVNRGTGTVVIEIPRRQVTQLLNDNAVEYISPDRPVEASGHIETTTGTVASKVINGVANTYDGTGIGIAVIDSGIDKSHDLLNKVVTTTSYKTVTTTNYWYFLWLAIPYVTTSQVPYTTTTKTPAVRYEKSFTTTDSSTTDPYGHGTLVASLISGRPEFGGATYTGIAPGANVLNLRVLNQSGIGRVSDVIAAIDWCITNKALYNIKVINLSLGAPAVDSYKTDPLCLAARRAFDAGIVVVAAAGNWGKDAYGNKLYGGINSPGIEPSVITVGASNTKGTDFRSDDGVATYSSRGPTRGYVLDKMGEKIYDNLLKPEIVAPGNRIVGAMSYTSSGNVLVAQNPGLRVSPVSQSTTTGLMQLSGTSVSAPIVSGTVALMLQANPNMTPSLVKSVLMYSAQQLPNFNTLEQGAGELNVHGAVQLARMIHPAAYLLAPGTLMLLGSLPTTQASLIAGQNAYWSQAVLHRYGFFHGSALMTHWQGMYKQKSLPTDAVSYVDGVPVLASNLVMNSVINSSGIVFADGRIMADGNTLAKGIVFADGSLDAGDRFVDGRIMYDPSVLLKQGILPAATLGE